MHVGFGLVGIAITPDGRTAYVLDSSSGIVVALDTATNTVRASRRVTSPWAIAIKPHAGTAYIANYSFGTSTVTPVHLATIKAGPPITVGSDPIAIAFAPDGATAFAVNTLSDSVTPIDTATNTPGTPIPVGHNPNGIAITPDQAPTARFRAGAAPAGSPTSFDASGSSGPSSPVVQFHWDFGDGTIAVSTEPVGSHVYANPGSYTVALTVRDAAGTNTRTIFTGQTMSRNGGPTARMLQVVTIT